MFVLRMKKVTISVVKMVTFSYIIRILLHFARKLCNVTNLTMFFLAVVEGLPRPKFSQLCNLSIVISIRLNFW